MDKPISGERNICKECGREIEYAQYGVHGFYIGPWRHIGSEYRHRATPKHEIKQEQKQ